MQETFVRPAEVREADNEKGDFNHSCAYCCSGDYRHDLLC